MPRPLKMIFAHSEQKKLTSLFATPLYTMADARYIRESSQFSKDTLLSLLFMVASYNKYGRRMCGGHWLD